MQYDDLSSATTWTSDNDRLPQDYLDGVLAQMKPNKHPLFDYPVTIWTREQLAFLAKTYYANRPSLPRPNYHSWFIRAWYKEFLDLKGLEEYARDGETYLRPKEAAK